MDAPRLAWLGNNPVIVGAAIPDDDEGRVRVWTFVSGSESHALPDELEYGDGQDSGFSKAHESRFAELRDRIEQLSRGSSPSAPGYPVQPNYPTQPNVGASSGGTVDFTKVGTTAPSTSTGQAPPVEPEAGTTGTPPPSESPPPGVA